MRTTVDIPDALYRELKSKAAREKTSVKQLILRSVTSDINSSKKPRRRRRSTPIVRSEHPGSLEIDNAKIYDILFP